MAKMCPYCIADLMSSYEYQVTRIHWAGTDEEQAKAWLEERSIPSDRWILMPYDPHDAVAYLEFALDLGRKITNPGGANLVPITTWFNRGGPAWRR
jgi:hypothetical protein